MTNTTQAREAFRALQSQADAADAAVYRARRDEAPASEVRRLALAAERLHVEAGQAAHAAHVDPATAGSWYEAADRFRAIALAAGRKEVAA